LFLFGFFFFFFEKTNFFFYKCWKLFVNSPSSVGIVPENWFPLKVLFGLFVCLFVFWKKKLSSLWAIQTKYSRRFYILLISVKPPNVVGIVPITFLSPICLYIMNWVKKKKKKKEKETETETETEREREKKSTIS